MRLGVHRTQEAMHCLGRGREGKMEGLLEAARVVDRRAEVVGVEGRQQEGKRQRWLKGRWPEK